ncbi:hypothetical protein Aduo_014876 [Ancylostoma duodenale]
MYVGDKKYNASDWKTIKKTKFPCDFIETACKFQNTTKKFIHTRIEEKKSLKEMPSISREKYPDVHLIVLDSVASTHFIRALPRTTNFLVNGMEAVQFRKLNKVGWNSRPNGFATLLGKTTEPVVRTLMKLKTIEPDLNQTELCSKFLDNETYIPMEYRSAGYKGWIRLRMILTLETSTQRALCAIQTVSDWNTIDHYYRPFHVRVREDKELTVIHEEGRCRGSLDNILEYLDCYVNSYKVEEIS